MGELNIEESRRNKKENRPGIIRKVRRRIKFVRNLWASSLQISKFSATETWTTLPIVTDLMPKIFGNQKQIMIGFGNLRTLLDNSIEWEFQRIFCSQAKWDGRSLKSTPLTFDIRLVMTATARTPGSPFLTESRLESFGPGEEISKLYSAIHQKNFSI